jgi:hypothetical protein
MFQQAKQVHFPSFKTLPAMICAACKAFFESLTAVSGFDAVVFISQTKVPVSKTMLSTSD